MVGAKQMSLISIFLDYSRTAVRIAHGEAVANVAQEARSSVRIAAIAKVVALQTIALNETTCALTYGA
jgi:hypothetical protein